MSEERIVIDLRRKPQETSEELDADLVIEIDLYEDGYTVTYINKVTEPLPHLFHETTRQLDRPAMVAKHVEAIRRLKPKTAVIRTGKNSTGYVKDIPLHPGVIKSIIEGKLDATALTLRS